MWIRLLEIILANSAVALLLAVAAAVCARYTRRPALAHALWLLVLLKLITPPLFDWRLPVAVTTPRPPVRTAAVEVFTAAPAAEVVVAQPVERAATNAAPPAVETAATIDWRAYVVPALAGVWLAGAGLWLSLLAVRAWRFHGLAVKSEPGCESLQQQTRELAADLGVARVPTVRVIRARVSPLLWRMRGRPVIVLPAELLDELTTGQIAGILAHELAHLRRRDHWTRRFVLLVTAVYWWHPLVWWARRGLDRAAEQCCDALVVHRSSGRDYAAALLRTIDFLSGARPPLPASATTFGEGRNLKQRFEMILDKGVSARLSWRLRGLLFGVGLAVLAVSPMVVAEDSPGESPAKTPALQDGNEKGAQQPAYRVTCRIVHPDQGKDIDRRSFWNGLGMTFSSLIVVRPGDEGTLSQRLPTSSFNFASSKFDRKEIVTVFTAKVRVEERKGDRVTLFATIESSPFGSTNENKAEKPAEDEESSIVFSHKLDVVKKVRLGETVKVPYDGGRKVGTGTWRYVEFNIERVGATEPAANQQDTEKKSSDARPAPAPKPDPPTAGEMMSMLRDILQQEGNADFWGAETETENLRLTAQLKVNELGPAKNYPLVGPARLHKQKYECTAHFDLVRKYNWPVRFSHKQPRREVFFIDRDHLVCAEGDEQ